MYSPPAPGLVVADRFRLGAALAHGFFHVFSAVDLRRDEAAVVVKFAPGVDGADLDGLMQRLTQATQIDDPRIPRVHAVGVTDAGVLWCAQQLVVGPPLRGPLPAEDVVAALRVVAHALRVAHDHGLPHGALSPSKIIRSGAGVDDVVVRDFGCWLMRLPPPRSIAPEQIRAGSPPDEKSDVWGLGVTIYELIAGRRPFAADTVLQELYRAVVEHPPPLSASARVYPFLRFLEKDPAQRPDLKRACELLDDA